MLIDLLVVAACIGLIIHILQKGKDDDNDEPPKSHGPINWYWPF